MAYSVHMEARRYSVGVARNASKRVKPPTPPTLTRKERRHARQIAHQLAHQIDRLGAHPLGLPRSSEPVQAWAKYASRLAYEKAHKRTPQRAPVEVLPMD